MNRYAALVLACVPLFTFAQSPTLDALREELQRRDAVIEDLKRRVESLEEPGKAPKPSAGPAIPARQVSSRAEDALLSRALERSLVRSGGELLDVGEMEIEPSVHYEYTRRSGLAIVGDEIASQDVIHKSYYGMLGLRVGLPWGSQLEFAVPYGRDSVEIVTAGVSRSASDTGTGDYEIGFSKTLFVEGPRWPGVIGNVTWQNSSGNSSLGLLADPSAPADAPSLGAGHDALHFSLTAVKRLDPLVLVGAFGRSFNRSATLGSTTIDPGDSNDASFTAILAASPSVSLRAGFSVSWSVHETRIDGVALPGSKQTTGVLELATSVVVSRSTLIDLSIGIGATKDAPDFTVGLSLPVRF